MVMSNMDTSCNANTEDAWSQQTTFIAAPSRRAAPQPTPVPDAWDADDNDDEPDAKELWETANSRVPMPEIQLSTTSSSSGVSLPPPAAFEAPMRILKRPSAANSKSPSPVTGTQTQKTLQEREAQYQAARDRIFGEDKSRTSGKDGSGAGKATTTLDSARSSISRDPWGPTSVTDGEADQSFRARRGRGVRAETETSTLEGGDIKDNDHPTDT